MQSKHTPKREAKLFTKANKERGQNQRTTNKALSVCPQRQSHTLQDVLHTGNGYRISQRFIPGGVGRAGDRCPTVRETLEPLTFQWGQAADEPHSKLFRRRFDDKAGSALVPPCALGAGKIAILEHVCPLAAVDRVAVTACQGICDILLIPDAVPAVLRLAADGVPGNTVDGFLLHQRQVVSPVPALADMVGETL